MKRLPITADERLFLKSIEATALVYLLMFKIYPHPLNSDALAFEMKWDTRKAKRMLDDLSSDGFTALMKGQGYVLTSQARAMVVKFFGNLISMPLEAQALAQGSQDQAHEALEAKVIIDAENTHGARALVVGESLTTEFKNESTTPTQSAQNVRWPSTEQILAATPILFGEPGVVRGKLDLDEKSPHYALAVIAHCYDLRKTRENQKGLYAPAGMAYQMLAQDKQPRAEYLNDPLEHLPNEYLEKLGLAEYLCDLCERKFSKLEELKAHEVTHQAEHEAIVIHATDEADLQTEAVSDEVNSRGYFAWQTVKDQLHQDMPRASWDGWVRDAEFISFDGDVLTIGTRNQYSADWLESRLTSTINRMLIGIMNADVTVRFSAYSTGEE